MELDNTTKENIEKMIGENDVFLFMKGNPDFPMCGFSSVASAILKKCGVDFGHCNVLDDEEIREGIKVFSNWPTIPQLYIKKEFVGGCDIMKEMAESGELIELFNTRGIKTEISGYQTHIGLKKLRENLNTADIKFAENRLTLTMTIINVKYSDFDNASKIITDAGFEILN